MMRKILSLALITVFMPALCGASDTEAKHIKAILRPEMQETGYNCVSIAREGSYSVSVNEWIELDIRNPTITGCAWDRADTLSDNRGVIEYVHHSYSVDAGDQGISVVPLLLKAVKPGQATVTVTIDNTVSFQYHFTVLPK